MKLVRDLIPDIITKSGRNPIWHIAESDQYIKLLKIKLREEVEEFLEDFSIEEVADILEVLEAICSVHGYLLKDILKIKQNKKHTNGGFAKRIILNK